MANITIDNFYQYVAPYVTGAPKQIVLNEIMSSIIDFCEETDILEVELDPIAVSAGETEFDLAIPVGTRVTRVKSLRVEGNVARFGDGSYVLVDGSFIKFHDPLPMDLAITPTVAIKPTRASLECDGVLLEDWLEAIVAGALLKLKSMVGREWEDMTSAKLNEGLLRRMIVKARNVNRTGRVYGISKVNFEDTVMDYFV
jgi:hypothetical protein